MKVEFELKTLEADDDCEIAIIPALFHEKRLIAYGNDILSYFKQKK